MSSSGTRSRALERALATIQTDFYEAQQQIKSIYHRQRSKQQLQDSYATLTEGAVQQLQAGHVTCGIELGLLLVEALQQDKVVPDVQGMAPVLQIVQALPVKGSTDNSSSSATQGAQADVNNSGSSSSAGAAESTQAQDAVVEESERLIGAAAKWAGSQPRASKQAARQLHGLYADYLWKRCGARQLGRVVAHAVKGDAAQLLAQVVRTAASPAELPVFTTYVVLKVLSSAKPATKDQQLQYARAVWQALAPTPTASETSSSSTNASSAPPEGGWSTQPLYNFCGLLLDALDRRSLPLVRLLRDRYMTALATDPTWESQLNRTEGTYLGVRGGGMGALGGLLSSLMQGMGGGGAAGGMDEDEDEMSEGDDLDRDLGEDEEGDTEGEAGSETDVYVDATSAAPAPAPAASQSSGPGAVPAHDLD